MQILAEKGTEFELTKGLNIIAGVVGKLPSMLGENQVILPHIGWNKVTFAKQILLFDSICTGAHFYFLHSYYFRVVSKNHIVWACDYGVRFPCLIRNENVVGVQFYPAESHVAAITKELYTNVMNSEVTLSWRILV